MQRRTRIVATLGPATDRPGVLEQLIDAGLDVARINFSHGAAGEHERRLQRLRHLAMERKRDVAILGDLPGPKWRANIKAAMDLQVGHTLTIARQPGALADVNVTEPEALAKIVAGHRVLLDD